MMNCRTSFFLYFFTITVALSSCSSAGTTKIGAATFSPDGQYLIFSIRHKQKQNIYRIRRDGTELTQLTALPYWDSHPVYSPDESKIVFARTFSANPGSDADLYIMNSDGSEQTLLTTGPAHDMFPAFSPDGQRIYFVRARWFGRHSPFVSHRWSSLDLFSIDADGSNLKAITDEWHYEMSKPSISPDGKKILVRLWIYENPDSLWIIPLENPKAMEAIRPKLDEGAVISGSKSESPYEYFYDPQFSPDGNSIVFQQVAVTSDRGYYEYELYRMDLESGNVKKLTNLKSHTASPSFPPNGKEIAFIVNPRWPKGDGPNELWIMNSDGTNPRQIPLNLD